MAEKQGYTDARRKKIAMQAKQPVVKPKLDGQLVRTIAVPVKGATCLQLKVLIHIV